MPGLQIRTKLPKFALIKHHGLIHFTLITNISKYEKEL